MSRDRQRLVVVSNRLPIVISEGESGWEIKPGAGGLITALAPVLSQRDGLWIGWPGAPPEAPLNQLLAEASRSAGHQLQPVALDEELIKGYYGGFSNEILWPLFHDMLDRCVFDPAYWAPYSEANELFAEAVATSTQPDDFVWVQDYHLMLVARAMSQRGVKRRMGFFLHIPFPSPDLFRRLPWRRELVEALLDYEVLGFQTEHDRRNFVRTVRAVVPEARVESRRRAAVIHHGDGSSRAGHFPIGIDYDHFAASATTKPVEEAAWLFHENFPRRTIILGVDRLDYTKGIRRRMRAYQLFLEKYPELHKQVSLVQIVVPSRTDVPEYQMIQRQLEQMVGHINGRFSHDGWVPLHYVFRSVPFVELLGAYRASEVMLVTPLRDGMNLVAKEFCAAHADNCGVLILSEFAGAAARMQSDAIMVNPNDLNQIADAIHQAVTMPQEERAERMKRLRSEVRRNDVHRWAANFLAAANLS